MIDTGLTIAPDSGHSAVNLRNSILQAVSAAVPAGQHGAVGIVGDGAGAHAFIVGKTDNGWQFIGGADVTKDGKHVSGSVSIVKSW